MRLESSEGKHFDEDQMPLASLRRDLITPNPTLKLIDTQISPPPVSMVMRTDTTPNYGKAEPATFRPGQGSDRQLWGLGAGPYYWVIVCRLAVVAFAATHGLALRIELSKCSKPEHSCFRSWRQRASSSYVARIFGCFGVYPIA
jgi:hypothetical protein